MPRLPSRMMRMMLVTRRVEWALASLGRQWAWLPFRAETTAGAMLGPEVVQARARSQGHRGEGGGRLLMMLVVLVDMVVLVVMVVMVVLVVRVVKVVLVFGIGVIMIVLILLLVVAVVVVVVLVIL